MCRSIVGCWQTLAGDKQLTRHMFEHLLDLLANSLPYKEKSERGGIPTFLTAPVPMAVSQHSSYESYLWLSISVLQRVVFARIVVEEFCATFYLCVRVHIFQ